MRKNTGLFITMLVISMAMFWVELNLPAATFPFDAKSDSKFLSRIGNKRKILAAISQKRGSFMRKKPASKRQFPVVIIERECK